ncbi:hypothetical protein NYP18_08955 [Corynebacterium sp. YIM 101645]|uniref:Uncharacterized protein n=1 Tax=Corynebacterium lemuris TaxID=1859292 RepID=A0ABT2FX22_9CORY|nr:hypothetical protein [Corynebacterium lemuris]MCS5479787.1 hypothetical protein [Corynebacterium lemuris]
MTAAVVPDAQWVSVADAAVSAGLSETTIHRMCEDDELRWRWGSLNNQRARLVDLATLKARPQVSPASDVEWITAAEAAARLGVTAMTIHRHAMRHEMRWAWGVINGRRARLIDASTLGGDYRPRHLAAVVEEYDFFRSYGKSHQACIVRLAESFKVQPRTIERWLVERKTA